MEYTDLFLITAGICLTLLCLYLFRKSGRFFASFFLSLASGTGGLLAVNLLSTVTAVSIPLNPVTVIFSSATGLSGVISLVLWQIVFSL